MDAPGCDRRDSCCFAGLDGVADGLRQGYRLAGGRIHPHQHHVAVGVHAFGIVGVDDAVADGHRAGADAFAAEFDHDVGRPFDGAAVIDVTGHQHRHHGFVEPGAGHALEPLQPCFFEKGEEVGVVDVVEGVEVAPADGDGRADQGRGRLFGHAGHDTGTVWAQGCCDQGFRCGARKRPVCDFLFFAMASGVPVAMMRPPPSPPSGPRSTTQSAVLMTSRLCSITTTVLPWSTSWCSTSSNCSMSWKCRPVVGSSRMYSVRPVSRRDSSLDSFTRCASPPDSVVALWPSLM